MKPDLTDTFYEMLKFIQNPEKYLVKQEKKHKKLMLKIQELELAKQEEDKE